MELVTKVLDGRASNGKHWFFYGALSNVEYTVTVTDTQTGRIKTYTNPRGRFASVGYAGILSTPVKRFRCYWQLERSDIFPVHLEASS